MQGALVQVSQTRQSQQPSLRYRVIHAIRGRIRLRVETTRLFADLTEGFEAFLRDLPGVREVSLNPSCHSVTLTYDPGCCEAETLLARMEALSLSQLKTSPPCSFTSRLLNSGSFPWLSLSLSSAAVVLGVLVESALTPWLVLVAAGPIFHRAYEGLTQKDPFNSGALDAAATTILVSSGQGLTAAVLVWLVSLGDFIRDRALQRTCQAIADSVNQHRATGIGQVAGGTPTWETRFQHEAEQFADRIAPWNAIGASVGLLTGSAGTAAALLISHYGAGVRPGIPTRVLNSLTAAARQKILIQRGRFLEQLAAVDVVVFAKTSVLTQGTLEIIEVLPYGKKNSAEQVLANAAAAETHLTHPLAVAVGRAAQDRGIAIPECEAVEYRSGLGVEAVVGGAIVLVGSHRFMVQKRVPLQRARKDIQTISSRETSPLFVAVDGKLIGVLAYRDPLRPEAAEVIQTLRNKHSLKEIGLLTGDHPLVVKRTAQSLGIARYLADAFPEQKAEFVQLLKREGHTVAVVVDGDNPSTALTYADVGIALYTRANAAADASQVALLEGSLWQLSQALDLARESVRRLRQHWNIAVYANTTALTLALSGLIGPLGAIPLSKGPAILATLNTTGQRRKDHARSPSTAVHT